MWPLFSRRKVLIVSERSREPTLDSAFLHQPGIRLLTTYPDAEGLELARKSRPALIVEHVCQEDGPALAFCRDLRSHPRTRSIPLILVAESALRPKIAPVRAEALLTTPLDRREYFDAVRRFVPMRERGTRRASVNLRFRYRADGRETQAFGRDISLGGAFIKSDRPLPLGTKLDVEFNIPGTWNPVRCSAVVRSGPMRDEQFGPGGFGIEFADLAEQDAERLELFIECCTRHRRS